MFRFYIRVCLGPIDLVTMLASERLLASLPDLVALQIVVQGFVDWEDQSHRTYDASVQFLQHKLKVYHRSHILGHTVAAADSRQGPKQ